MFVVDSLILVAGLLLLLGIASSKISARLGVPVLVLFLLLGMLAGSEGIGGLAFENYSLAYGIGTLTLAMILFDGGLSTEFQAVRSAWKPSLLLATLGVLITSLITGLAAAWILKISFLDGLLLGSIVGSTDAAAVFSVLRSGGVSLQQRLASILEIESGSNDPMAIFLTIGCIEVLTHRMPLGPELLTLFVAQMSVGAVLGIGMGYLAVWTVNRVELGAAGLYPVLISAFSLLTFGLAARLGGSGFLAVYLAGIVIGNQKIVFQRGIHVFHDALAWLSQILMFVMLGLLSFPSRLLQVSGQALLIGAVLILVARPVAVLISIAPFRFSWKELAFISWVGLKGAVPITLATFPLLMGTKYASLTFDVVFFIVVISAVIQGSSLPWMARRLGLQVPGEHEPLLTLEIHSLRHVDGEIVDYLVGENSRAAGKIVKDLALPEGVVIAMIVQADRIIPPKGGTRIQVGDHVILILAPGTRPLVNQIFGATEETRGKIPAEFEFPLRGSITVCELEQAYGIETGLEKNCTLDEALRRHLHPAAVIEGTLTPLGPISLRIRQLDANGNIESIGLSIHSASFPV